MQETKYVPPKMGAVMTTDGLIEITSLSLLDDFVGGLSDPEAAVCELSHEHINSISGSENL